MENLNSDNVKLNALDLKQLGDMLNKIKFHLNAALIEYNHVQNKCVQIENETGVKMRYMAD